MSMKNFPGYEGKARQRVWGKSKNRVKAKEVGPNAFTLLNPRPGGRPHLGT
jgi:hypothetical protein